MISLLKTVSFIIIFSVAPTVLADWYFNSGFLDKFMLEQSLSIMGTILAIYIAAAASFLAILMNHEEQKKQKIFTGTSTELKHNICFIMIIFFVHFILLTISQSADPNIKIFENPWAAYGLKAAKVFTFSIYIYALYELNVVLFGIRDRLKNET